MSEKAIKDFIEGKVTYDKVGQYFWISTQNDGLQMLAELRGWGSIQNIFKEGKNINFDKASEFQDRIGQFIADAINEKLQREALQKIFDIKREKILLGYQPTQDDTLPEPPKESGS